MNPRGAIPKPGAYSQRFKQFESERLRSETQNDDEASARAKQLRIEAKRRREKLERQRQRREAKETAAKEKVLRERKSRIQRHTEGFKSAVHEQRQKRAAEKKRKQTEELSAWAKVLDTQRMIMGYDSTYDSAAPTADNGTHQRISTAEHDSNVDLEKVQYHEQMLSHALEAIRGPNSPNRRRETPIHQGLVSSSSSMREPKTEERSPTEINTSRAHVTDAMVDARLASSPVPSVDSLDGSSGVSEGTPNQNNGVGRDSFDDAVRTLTGQQVTHDDGHAADVEPRMPQTSNWINRGRRAQPQQHRTQNDDTISDQFFPRPPLQHPPGSFQGDMGPTRSRSQAPPQHPRGDPFHRRPQHGSDQAHDAGRAIPYAAVSKNGLEQERRRERLQEWKHAHDTEIHRDAHATIPDRNASYYPSQSTGGYDITSGRTPTDDEINLLWDAMRKGLHEHRVGASDERVEPDGTRDERRPRQRVLQSATSAVTTRTSTASSTSSNRPVHGTREDASSTTLEPHVLFSPRHHPHPPSTTNSHASLETPSSRRGRPAETALARAKNVERLFLRTPATPLAETTDADNRTSLGHVHHHSSPQQHKNTAPSSHIPRLKQTSGKDPKKSTRRTSSQLLREEAELEQAIATLEIATSKSGVTTNATPTTSSTPAGKKPWRRRQVVVPAPAKLSVQEVEALRRSVHDTAAAIAAMKAANAAMMH